MSTPRVVLRNSAEASMLNSWFAIILLASLLVFNTVNAHAAESSPITGDSNASCELNPDNSNCTDAAASSDVGSAGGSNLPSDTVGNPVNLMTGNKSQQETDFAIPGAKLTFNRQYNSGNSDSNLGLGQGWHHSYAVSLYDGGNGTREIVQSNGSRIRFKADGEDDQGRPLMRGSAQHYGYVVQTDTHHEWHLPDGRLLMFQGSYLVRIDWPDQNRLEMFYRAGRLHSVTDETGRVLRFDYHAGTSRLTGFDENRFGIQAGHLASVTLPDGSLVEYDYDHNRNLSRVRYSDGSSREYHYESGVYPNHLTGLTDRTGVRFASWTYDGEGRAISSEHANGVEKLTLAYPEPKAVADGEIVQTLITNSLGDQSTFTWRQPSADAPPLLLSSEGAGCATCPPTGLNFSYDDQGRLLEAAKNSLGNAAGQDSRTYRYDEQGRIAEIRRVDVGGNDELIERREYVDNSALSPVRIFRKSVNPNGERVVEIERDDRGLPVRMTERGWSPLGNDLADTDTNGFEAIERVVELSYDDGRLVSIDGPRSDVEDITGFVWDDQQRLQRIDKPDSPQLHLIDVDILGRVTQFRLGAQSPVNMEYAGSGHTVASITQLGRTIRFSYDAESRLSAFTSPDGQIRRIVYNDAGLISELIDDNGQRTVISYDSEGRRTDTQEFGLDGVMIRSVSQLFDSLGRLSVTDTATLNATGTPNGRQLNRQYDEAGRLASVTDAASGDQLVVEHNAFGRLASITEPATLTVDAQGNETDTLRTGFEYDSAGNEVALIDGRNNRTLYLKDDFGRVVTLNSPESGITRYRYDAADNRIGKRQADGTETSYTWDAANRMTGKVRPDGEYRYAYSSVDGKLIESVAPETIERFGYDVEARLIRHERQIDSQMFVTGYRYDDNGRLSQKSLPDGQTLNYHYRDDEPGLQRGTLRAITRDTLFGLRQDILVAEIDQDGRDGSSGHISSNGLTTQLGYGADGSIISLNIDQTMKLEYAFDEAGRIVGIDANGTLQQFRYDRGGLSYADMGEASYRFDYDGVGNRIASSVEREDGSEEATSYRYLAPGSGNRLVETATLSRENTSASSTEEVASQRFNANGAAVAREGLSYEYDPEQRPVRVLDNGVLLAEYAYNGFGERIRKVTYSGDARKVTYFLYDGNTLTAEISEHSEQMRQAVFLDQAPVAYLIGRDVYAVHTDHLGTPRMATDSEGQTVWSADYAPFGKATIVDDIIEIPYRFAGQYFDAETDTHYNYYRDYDPATGRYITSDPIGLQGGINTYAYAMNNPLALTDPLGLNPGDTIGATGESPVKPDPDSEGAYSDKLEKVFTYAYDKLKNTDGGEVAAEFMKSLADNAAIVAGVVVAMAGATAAGYGAIAIGIVTAAGWILAGYEAGKFVIDTIKMALRLRDTELCDEQALKAEGEKLADSTIRLGTELTASVLLGALGKIGPALDKVKDYASDGAYTIYRKLRALLRAETPVARLCSFAGDTLVATQNGYQQIQDITVGKDRVWARDELTGNMGWRDVLAQYSNRYEETVHVTAVDESGHEQTISSNRIHPYFSRLAAGAVLVSSSLAAAPAVASEGLIYQGDIAGGAWVDAQHLEAGDELLGDDGRWLAITDVVMEDKPLEAWNLSVDDYATYFVAGDPDATAVWVHNRCYDDLPGNEYVLQNTPTAYGQPRYVDGDGNELYMGHDGRYYDPKDPDSAPSPLPDGAPSQSLDDLLVGGNVPTVRGGFDDWYDNLTPAEFDRLWVNERYRDRIKEGIRDPGGEHEWCMACKAPQFKRWGVSMDEIKRFRTKTADLEWVIPPGRANAGTTGYHNQNSGPQTGSTRLHNELQKITDESLTLEEFNSRVTELAIEWNIQPGLPSLPSVN